MNKESYIRKVLLNTDDKSNHEQHCDSNLKLHSGITGAYAFKIISAHAPIDLGTFKWYQNSIDYEESGSYTLPNIGKIRFVLKNTDTDNVILDAEFDTNNNTYTSGQIQTLLTNNFANSGIASWTVSGGNLVADFNPASFNRSAQLIAYTKDGEITSHDFINIDHTPRELKKQETFNSSNKTWNYQFEQMWTFPMISTFETTYDDPTSGHQIHNIIKLSEQAPVFTASSFLSILNTELSAKILGTFTANMDSTTGLYNLILTGNATSPINRLVSIVAKDPQGVIMERDGHLNLKEHSFFVPKNTQIPVTTLSTMVDFSGKLTFINSPINTFTFDDTILYTSQGIVDHLNNTEVEPSNTSITYSKNGDRLRITNATPNLNQSFYKIKKIEMNIDAGGHSLLQTMEMSSVSDTLNDAKFKAYLDYYLDGANLAGDSSTDKFVYTVSGGTVSFVAPVYTPAIRSIKFIAYDYDDQPIYNDGNLNFTGTDIDIPAGAQTASNITTTLSFPSLTGINASYADQTVAPRGKLFIFKNDVIGFTSPYVVINDGHYDANRDMILNNTSGRIITFNSSLMDLSNKTTFINNITKLAFVEDEQYTEATLITYLNANFASNFVWSFVNHKLKVVSSSSNKLRLYKNIKLGLVFNNSSDEYIDIDANGTYIFQNVLDGSTNLNLMIGLSIYNDSLCSAKHGDPHANNIACVLHNRSRDTYGDMAELKNPGDLYPINQTQFHNIRVQTYDEKFRLNYGQNLPTKLEIDIYCKAH